MLKQGVNYLRNHKKKRAHKKQIRAFFHRFPNCYYCRCQLTRKNRTLDHFIPQSKGGSGELNNLVTACTDCNHNKADLMPLTEDNDA